MKTFTGVGFKRYILINLKKGEDVLGSIIKAIEEEKIQYGMVVSGIGALRKTVYHRITTLEDDPTNQFVTVEGPTEMSALQGLIIDGEPHLHITCCDCEKAFAGHLELGSEVQYLAEIGIVEFESEQLTRKANQFGVKYIEYK